MMAKMNIIDSIAIMAKKNIMENVAYRNKSAIRAYIARCKRAVAGGV